MFVPLCGKSLDLVYLAEAFDQVVGIELVTRAVDDFFIEQRLKPEVSEQTGFKVYKSKNITILNGDMFNIDQLNLAAFNFVYDRASLVAFDEEARVDYAAVINRIVSPGCQQLLVSFNYDQVEMSGPPFSVNADMISEYYGDHWHIEKKKSQEMIQQEQRFTGRGLTSLLEEVYILSRKNNVYS